MAAEAIWMAAQAIWVAAASNLFLFSLKSRFFQIPDFFLRIRQKILTNFRNHSVEISNETPLNSAFDARAMRVFFLEMNLPAVARRKHVKTQKRLGPRTPAESPEQQTARQRAISAR